MELILAYSIFSGGAAMPSDYPQTPDTIRQALEAQAQERAASGLPQTYFDTHDLALTFDRERANDKLELCRIVEKYGAKTVDRWLHNFASMTHQEI